MDFVVDVYRDENWVEVPVGVGRANHYVRSVNVVAIPMNEKFRVTTRGESPVGIAQGEDGDYLVLDNGIPRSEEGYNFRATHVQIPPELDDDIDRVRVTIERILTSRIAFTDDQEPMEITDLILGAISSAEVTV